MERERDPLSPIVTHCHPELVTIFSGPVLFNFPLFWLRRGFNVAAFISGAVDDGSSSSGSFLLHVGVPILRLAVWYGQLADRRADWISTPRGRGGTRPLLRARCRHAGSAVVISCRRASSSPFPIGAGICPADR